MSCEAEEQALAKVRLHRLRAAHAVQYETSLAELDVLRSNARIYDWGTVRFAETLMRCWDSRCAQAENALERCKKRTKNEKMAVQHN
ncbi:MAG: hypothetical protein ACXV45_06170 [Halobacteriota archaeon]